MRWVKFPTSYSGEVIFGRVADDGPIRITCSKDNEEHLLWVTEGNTAEEVDR